MNRNDSISFTHSSLSLSQMRALNKLFRYLANYFRRFYDPIGTHHPNYRHPLPTQKRQRPRTVQDSILFTFHHTSRPHRSRRCRRPASNPRWRHPRLEEHLRVFQLHPQSREPDGKANHCRHRLRLHPRRHVHLYGLLVHRPLYLRSSL